MADAAAVLVTGASGYIGSHVVKELMTAGHSVRGTVRSVQNEVKVKHLHALCQDDPGRLQLVEADLTDSACWTQAVMGVDYVIHVASPHPMESPHTEEEVVQPAVQGTLHVLKACARSGSVKRVVLTSDYMAAAWRHDVTQTELVTEECWSDITQPPDAYTKSKTLAERAAWDFVNQLPDGEKFELAVINPAFVLGPPLAPLQCTSVQLIQKLLERRIQACPKMNLPIVDVRDVALVHVRAMTSPEAPGHRHLCSSGNLWMSQMATLLKSVFGPQGYDVPVRTVPTSMLRLIGKVDSSVRTILPHLGLVYRLDNTRMVSVLGVSPRDVRDTVMEMAHAVIQCGLVTRTPQYTSPTSQQRQQYLQLKL